MASKDKKKNTKKANNKSVGQESDKMEVNSSLQLKDSSINHKLDVLLEVMKSLDAKVQDEDACLQKREGCVSIANVSALPSAHSLPKKSTDQPEKLQSFEELKTNSKIQAEVDRQLQQYYNTPRTGVAHVKNQICWPQDFLHISCRHRTTYI